MQPVNEWVTLFVVQHVAKKNKIAVFSSTLFLQEDKYN